jgi:hypothetical protein
VVRSYLALGSCLDGGSHLAMGSRLDGKLFYNEKSSCDGKLCWCGKYLSWWEIVLVGNCLSGKLSWWEITFGVVSK